MKAIPIYPFLLLGRIEEQHDRLNVIGFRNDAVLVCVERLRELTKELSGELYALQREPLIEQLEESLKQKTNG